MKKLIPYMVVASFVIISAGYFSPFLISGGVAALGLTCWLGMTVLGAEDREFNSLIANLRLQADSNQSALASMVTKADSAHSKVSEALASLRRETSDRWPNG